MFFSDKPSPEKRGVGRPPGIPNKKKMTAIVKSSDVPKEGGPLIKTFKIQNPLPKITPPPPPEEPVIHPAKPAIPFALNILPKKNEPVDVAKAFGMDSIFLPRSLTPPEPEDNTVSAEETESAPGDLETSSIPSTIADDLPSTSFTNSTPLSPPAELPSPSFSSAVAQIIPSVEKSPISPSEQAAPIIEDSLISSGTTAKPILISASDAKKIVTLTATSSGFKTVFLQDKSLSSGSVSNIKSIADSSISAKTVSQITSPNVTKAMITVPYGTGGPLLVSGQTLKTPSGKIFQFLSKNPASVQPKDAATQLITPSHTGELSQKIIGATSVPRKIESTSSSATLVKLSAPEKTPGIKHIQVVKPPTSKVETAAEMIEKQLAIKALCNESAGLDAADEASVPYTKPSTSIISRVVPRPGHPPYIRQSIIAHPPGRGRIRPILPNKIYQIYPK